MTRQLHRRLNATPPGWPKRLPSNTRRRDPPASQTRQHTRRMNTCPSTRSSRSILLALEIGVPPDQLAAKLGDDVLVDSVGLRAIERHVAARLLDEHTAR